MPPQIRKFTEVFEEIYMKRFLTYAMVAALVSVPAFAAKNSQSITLPETVKVGSAQLAAGDCKVSWTGTGDSVQVTFEQRGKAPVTVAAKLITEKHNNNGVLTNSQGGVDLLESIQLSNVSLVLQPSQVSGQ
jgi:hypothetical protein